jgi:hydrogenase maturation protease
VTPDIRRAPDEHDVTADSAPTVVLIGGVGQLYQSDLDVGRHVAERLGAEDLGPGIAVEDMYYGAVEVSHLLHDLRPDALVLVGAEERGREPGSIERRRIARRMRLDEEAQGSVADAVTGYVSIDLVIGVAEAFDLMPARVVTIEIEPALTEPGETLSTTVEAAVPELIERVRGEARRAPMLGVADRIRETLEPGRLEPTPALEALESLLAELDRLDRDGAWGATFRERDRLRLRIGQGETGEGMDHLDWGLWWTLIEELDRIEKLDAAP